MMNGFMPSLEDEENFSYSLIFPLPKNLCVYGEEDEEGLFINSLTDKLCVCVRERQTKIIISMHKTLAVRV